MGRIVPGGHFVLTVKDLKKSSKWYKETVDEFYDFLKKKKVVVTEKPQHFPDYGDELYYAVFFKDPDGLRLELFFEIN